MRIFIFSVLLLVLNSFIVFSQETKDFTKEPLVVKDTTFKPNGKIVTQVFLDYLYVCNADTGIERNSNAYLKKKSDFNGFRTTRLFLGYEYNFTKKINTLIRYNVDELSQTYNQGKGNKYAIWMQDAYIKYTYTDYLVFQLGLQRTFSYDISEELWGQRFVDKTFIDARNIVGTRDFGLSVRGKFMKYFNYAIMIANNNAFNAENDNYKRLYNCIGYTSKFGLESVYTLDYAFKNKVKDNNVNEINQTLYIGFKQPRFSIGVEGLYKKSNNGYTLKDKSITDKITYGYSVFGNANIISTLNYFIRYDRYEPNKNSESIDDKTILIITGLSYKYDKITISPNFSYEEYEGTDYTPSLWFKLSVAWKL